MSEPLRQPEPNEVPLSAEEIAIGIKLKLIEADDECDTWPIQRKYVQAGCWGIQRRGLRHAQVWDGLKA